MVEVLVILDGASEPLGPRPTTLERARTPVLDRLARDGALARVRTVPRGLVAGSETAIPALLGWVAPGPVDRGALEAAARGIKLAPGHHAWRIDVLAGDERADERRARRAALLLRERAPGHELRYLGGHRLLLVGPSPLPSVAREYGLSPWPEGVVPPRILGSDTVMVAARGAAAGVARLMGATTLIPRGATGQPQTDLGAKLECAVAAIAGGASRVVVHVGGPDEAAHQRDRAAKVAAIERIDRQLILPLARVVYRARGSLRVCPDHGCDPRTGSHDAEPVPSLTWPARATLADARFTERDVAALAVTEVELADGQEAA